MERVHFEDTLPQLMKLIQRGALLTVKAGNDLNVMTIGWLSVGIIWAKPLLTVAARPTRHTHGIMERAVDFTVSAPTKALLGKLEFCGSRSGRTVDKFKECNLETAPALKTHSPVLAIAAIHYECKIVYKSPVNPEALCREYLHLYPDKDYHTLYYGEILECYSTTSPQ